MHAKSDENQVLRVPLLDTGRELTFIWAPLGKFIMGSPEDEPGHDDDEIQHEVVISKGFYIQTAPVTQGQWTAVMGRNPSSFRNCGEDCPVETVSWNDVQEFVYKLNQDAGKDIYRLPTEAEWEYACRAGTNTAIYTGPLEIIGDHNAPALNEIAWYGGNSCVDYKGGRDCSEWKEKQYKCKICGPTRWA